MNNFENHVYEPACFNQQCLNIYFRFITICDKRFTTVGDIVNTACINVPRFILTRTAVILKTLSCYMDASF